MDSTLLSPRSLSPRSEARADATKSRLFTPLSPHGMPKAPPKTDRPHRFSSIPPPINLIPSSPPLTPMSNMMSPPMSAKSFDTLIESAPSTPAWSPRTASGWDDSTIMLLSPTSTAPSEPEWEMMAPVRKPSRTPPPAMAPKGVVQPLTFNKDISSGTSLASHPITPLPYNQVYYNKENHPPNKEPIVEVSSEEEAKEEGTTLAAPLGKIATRFRSMLKRKTTISEKRSQRRRRQYDELERMETVHWTDL